MPTPIYGCGRSPRPDGRRGPATHPKVAPMGGALWSTPISKTTFLENLGSGCESFLLCDRNVLMISIG